MINVTEKKVGRSKMGKCATRQIDKQQWELGMYEEDSITNDNFLIAQSIDGADQLSNSFLKILL